MAQLCAQLGHAANGWPATVRVRCSDGGTVDLCDMCAASLERAVQATMTVNCRDRLVWVGGVPAVPLGRPEAPSASTASQREGPGRWSPAGQEASSHPMVPGGGGTGWGESPASGSSRPGAPAAGRPGRW